MQRPAEVPCMLRKINFKHKIHNFKLHLLPLDGLGLMWPFGFFGWICSTMSSSSAAISEAKSFKSGIAID